MVTKKLSVRGKVVNSGWNFDGGYATKEGEAREITGIGGEVTELKDMSMPKQKSLLAHYNAKYKNVKGHIGRVPSWKREYRIYLREHQWRGDKWS